MIRNVSRTLVRAAVLGLAMSTAVVSVAEAAGVLTIGRREDGTTFDPIATAQNTRPKTIRHDTISNAAAGAMAAKSSGISPQSP